MEGSTIELVAIATVFAVVVTKTVDLTRNVVNQIVGKDNERNVPKWTWNVASLGLGVAMALIWRVNVLDNYSAPDSVVQGVFGQVLTGLTLGAAASGYHEFFDVLSSTAKRARPREERVREDAQ